jgi:hypothetical protein
MEQRTESIRELLLSRLPEPKDLPAYRNEVASLLAKHEKAFFWEKWSVYVGYYGGCAFAAWVLLGPGKQFLGKPGGLLIEVLGFVAFMAGAVGILKLFIYRSRIEFLKEVKQVQLQVLELQASLRERGHE